MHCGFCWNIPPGKGHSRKVKNGCLEKADDGFRGPPGTSRALSVTLPSTRRQRHVAG